MGFKPVIAAILIGVACFLGRPGDFSFSHDVTVKKPVDVVFQYLQGNAFLKFHPDKSLKIANEETAVDPETKRPVKEWDIVKELPVVGDVHFHCTLSSNPATKEVHLLVEGPHGAVQSDFHLTIVPGQRNDCKLHEHATIKGYWIAANQVHDTQEEAHLTLLGGIKKHLEKF